MNARKQTSRVSPEVKAKDPHTSRFPIAGIGASAGGLEALEQFLVKIPENSGMAYVVVQHLDPTQKGMLPELLQRVTEMEVHQAKNRMAVKQNCVYVIPPNKSMSISKGALHLSAPHESRGKRLPVDFFFRTLAEDRKELSIGIILSGMGSDGSLGLRAIKENNGIVLVQEPSTAKFDSMPRNAIDSVVVDVVASPGDLPGKLIDFFNRFPAISSGKDIEIKDESALEKIVSLLRTYTGNDFSFYKKNTMHRRIERRMGVHKIDKIAEYVTFLQENPIEGDILFKEMMIGVTNFFRDPDVWEKLGNSVLSDAIADLPEGSVLRAWVPGCSTGEEAYTLAIIFKEAFEKASPRKNIRLQIFATDLDNDSVEAARKGIYPVNIATDVSPDRLNRYFVKSDDSYRVNAEIREMIVFAQHNLIMHPPFINIDIISCRNLLIYLDADLQKKIIGLFYYSINNKGILLLGNSETIGTLGHLFQTVDARRKIYTKSANTLAPDTFNFPAAFSRPKTVNISYQKVPVSDLSIEAIADQLLAKQFAPPGVLVNENGDIIYISGRTGKYLEPATGKANMNIFAMLRDDLRQEVSVAFNQAIRKKGSLLLQNIKVGTNGNKQTVDVKIHWIDKPEQLKGKLMIVFIDLPKNSGIMQNPGTVKKSISSSREAELEKELQHMREQMQSTIEEMQTSQEEQKTTNEELQSANEELQSTNEELTSSKEEMQSLNEELQTVNAELQAKVDDFSRVDNDMKNLLNSTDIATLFLDKELNIRRYTYQATKIFKLIKSDIGRPFTDLVSNLDYPEMTGDALKVLKSLIFIQKQIPGKNHQWFSVRIMPYRTFDDRIDGLVITFINITGLKQSEEKLNEKEQFKRLLVDSAPGIIIHLSKDLKILEFNSEAEKYFGTRRSDTINQEFIQLFIPEPVQRKSERLLNKMLKDREDGKFKVQTMKAGKNTQIVEWSVKVILNKDKTSTGLILTTKIDCHEN
jgi:two-component system, chemotaxis family, CheB/CheR fusion protein